MKKLILIVLFNLLAIEVLIAQEKSITQERALSIVQSYYSGQNVDYYLLTERTEQWAIFVDEMPFANWEHSCAIYTFPNTSNLAVDSVPIKQAMMLPPNEDIVLIGGGNARNTRSVSGFNPIVIQPGDVVSNDSVAQRTFAVILSGGMYKYMNYHRYWNDCSFIYQVLRKAYGVPRSNIKVIMSDGCDTAVDMRLHEGGFISSPLDLDLDGTDDITCAATKDNLYAVLESMSGVMTKDDHLFLYVIDHGMSYNKNTDTSCIYLWDSVRLFDYELAEKLLCFTQKGVSVNVVMGQCYSGGFIDELSNIGCVIATASDADNPSYARPLTCDEGTRYDYDEFVFHWASAINGADPYGNVVNADADNNGRISMLEAFNYAKANDQFSNGQNVDTVETPQYSSTPGSIGEDLAFNNLPQALDLYIKDNINDNGVENSQMAETFWQASSIWVRNDDDDETEHQNPIYSSDDTEAFVYVKIHNRGRDNYAGGSKWLHVNWALASTAVSVNSWFGDETYGEFPTGGHLNPVAIPALASGDSCVVKVSWELPVEQMQQDSDSECHHLNLIARIKETSVLDSDESESQMQYDIRGLNNFAQKSIALISKTQRAKSAKVFMRNVCMNEHCYSLEVRPHEQRDTILFARADVELMLSQQLLNSWASGNYCGEDIDYSYVDEPLIVALKSGNSKLKNIAMSRGQLDLMTLKFDFHTPSPSGVTFSIDLVQCDAGNNVVGGQTYVVEAPIGIEIDATLTPGGPGPIAPIDTIPSIGGGIITLGANLDDSEQVSVWTDSNGDVIGNSTTVEVIPTSQNNTYSLRVLTAEGELYSDSITLEPTLGIKSVMKSTNKNGCIVVDFLSEVLDSNSQIVLQSMSHAMTPIRFDVTIGANYFEIDVSNLRQGLYAVAYVVDGMVIDAEKVSL